MTDNKGWICPVCGAPNNPNNKTCAACFSTGGTGATGATGDEYIELKPMPEFGPPFAKPIVPILDWIGTIKCPKCGGKHLLDVCADYNCPKRASASSES